MWLAVRRVGSALLPLFLFTGVFAQKAPVALPNTISTTAGGATTATAGAACSGNAAYTATDALGDGCPGAAAVFSSDLRGGVAVDPQGNVWVADTSNSAIREIRGRSGVVTLGAGRGTACTAKTDSNGDGCPVASTVFSSTPRGIATDPWGNVLVAGYGSGLVQVICNATSPLCTNVAGGRLVGNMYAVAGCVATTSSAGTNGTSADGGIALPTGTCSSSVTELNQPRGVAADRYGNVFIADTASARYRVIVGPASFNGVANPMAAVLALNPTYATLTAASAAGHIYGILGGYTSPASAAACVSGSSATATDALGDGCPYYVSSTNSSTSSVQGVTVDPDGDALFTPASDLRLRVLYMGGATMAKLITLENPLVTAPVIGSIYSLAGGGTTSASATPSLGSRSVLDSSIFKVASAPNGDVYIGDNTSVLYLDATTGYLRKLFTSGAVCAAKTDAIGDGCPASGSVFGGSNGLGVALDSFGNLFLADTTNARVREVAATALLPTAVGASSTQTLLLHNSASSAATALTASTEVTAGAATCGTVNGDSTVECSVPVTFAPAQPGTRTAALATSGAVAGTLALSGTATGAALAIDTGAPVSTNLGSGIKPVAVAVSGSGAVYAVDATTGSFVKVTAAGNSTLASGAPTSAAALAVDSAETLYAVGAGSTAITTATLGANGQYSVGSLSYTPATSPAAPRAVAVDTAHTVYVYDATNQAIYGLPTSAIAASVPAVVGTGYSNVTGLALDGSGNLFAADAGAGTVYRISSAGVQTAVATGVTPAAIAVDAAGTLYVQDSATGSVFAYPVSGARVTVTTGLTTPAGLATDGTGNLFSADAAKTSVSLLTRSTAMVNFGASTTATQALSLSNAGNAAATGFAQTDSSDFALTAGTSNGCNLGATSFAQGASCSAVASFTPTASGTGAVSDVLTVTPSASSIGSLTLLGTKTGSAVTTTTSVNGQTPAAPVYSATGTEVSFAVTVTASSGAVTGNVNVTVDSGTAVSYPLSNNVATVALSGLAAGSHTIAATYLSQGGVVGSSSSVVSFAIAQQATAVSWTPGALTRPVGQALGNGVLNATANGVAGAYLYTATPSAGGAAVAVDAASYLPVGTYALAVSFVPTDATDYSTASASGGNFSVTKAVTSSAVGATTNLVAADGSGNYTTLTAAVAALPVTGGAIYLAPGTYTGQVTIPYPNVSLRGLGGDPTKVVITAEAGASTTAQNGGKTGDQGSSTLNVDKTTVGSTTYTPNNFYAEGVSINNTWNTDTNYNPSALVSSSGSCIANSSQLSNSALYNAGTLCYSQALAVWITSDQAVFNNVYLNSLQDTLYAGSQGASGASYVPARQYFWKGYISGDVDYIFGDAALVFDQAKFYTAWHGTTATGTETISAQNKKVANGSTNDYLSGYVMNSCTLTSQSTGMTNLYLGRPYGQFSTHILRNTNIDQVNPLGWIEFSGDNNLPTSTYAEYNSIPYTDAQGNTGQGVTGTREATSIAPQMLTAAQAAKYAPVAFLGTAVNGVAWDPTAALTAQSNAFVPTATLNITAGTSVTLLYRPQTPGAGVVPTGTYTISNNGSVLATGSLDASGSAYLTTTALPVGTNNLTVSYAGDANFNASASSTPYVVTVVAGAKSTALLTVTPSMATVYGTAATVAVAASPASGTTAPSGSISLTVDGGTAQTMTLNGGTANFTLTGLGAGAHTLSVVYGGDANYNTAVSSASLSVGKAPLTVTAQNLSVAYGAALPAYTAAYSGFANGDTAATALTGTPSLTTTPAAPTAIGTYTITAAAGTLAAANYTLGFANGTLTITAPAQAQAVATGDTRAVTEPSFPAVCTTLTAALRSVNDDLPAAVDAANTNPDGTRIQAAMNACAAGQAVELSSDATGNNAFLTGPLVLPSGVTLLIDPGVTMYGSRNAQDYDTVAGTHTCGTVNANSATSSCQPLISINNVSNVGIMGYGKIDGRGGDVVLNSFPASYAGQTWWGLATIANSGGNQQNPRMIQITKATNVTFYKITLKNSTMFHISTTGGTGVTGMTAWDVKIVTPTSARNTDGIDPGNVNNVTITRSYISDGDDNVAVGASGTTPSQNISVTNNHFYAGHGESIGSYTQGGVNNVLFDGNMLSGNGSADSNSTGIRIKSANDRGGVVQNIQYSNSCLQNHKTLAQFTPLYNTNTGTLTPNFKNILLQNLSFLTEGTVQLTGASNNGTVNPLSINFDNVGFTTLSASDLSAAPSNATVTLGPGQVSTNFVTALNSYNGTNGVSVVDSRTAASLLAPVCSFINLAAELTGPNGTAQTVVAGQAATAVVVLTPTVASTSYPYPTGTVTLSDGNGFTAKATLPGTTDTVLVPLTGLSAGSHTFTASYTGDAVYVPATGASAYLTFGSYNVTVNAGSLPATTITLTGVPTATTYGTTFATTATVAGATSGSVQFLVNGAVFSYANLSNGVAQGSFNLPVGTYTISALYTGSSAAAASATTPVTVTVGPAATTTTLVSSAASTTVGVQVNLTATVSSTAGTPTGTVSFAASVGGAAAVNVGTATLSNGVGTVSANLPLGTDAITASYAASTNFAASASAATTVTVNPPAVIALPSGPVVLPSTVSTIAGGATGTTANTSCSGSTDAYGDGCQATTIALNGSSLDLRSIVADPFGNLYLTDANASLVRRISPSGVITNFAGYVSGTACVPSATTACTATLVKLNKPRGVSSDAAGNIFIAGYSDNKVYEVKVTDGMLYLVAGSGTKPTDPTTNVGDGATATSANLNGPRSAAADSYGNLYIADTSDNRIRQVNSAGLIQTVAGTGVSSSTGDGGLATAATVSNPQGVLVDPSDNLYIADAARVRVVCNTCTAGSGLYNLLVKLGVASPANGFIYTLAGTGSGTYNYTASALANTINVAPQKLAMDAATNLYISDSNGVAWFLDARSGYLRLLAGKGTSCNTSTIGDGCVGTQASFGTGTGGGIGVGVDLQGNAYVSDTLNGRIRKIANNLNFPAETTGTSTVQTLTLHMIPGDTLGVTKLALTSPDFTSGTVSCTTNTDTTQDCAAPVTFTAAVPGPRSASLAVTTAGGNASLFGLTGAGNGAGATLDPGSQAKLGTGLTPAAVAVDGTGNVLVADSVTGKLLRFPAGSSGTAASATTLLTLSKPVALAVDSRGYAYVADGSGTVTQVSPGGASASFGTFAGAAGLATDSLNNLYVSSSSGAAVYQVSANGAAQRALITSGLTSPGALATDAAGNLLVADSGTVYRYNTSSLVRSAATTAVSQIGALAADAAGNLLVGNTAANSVVAVPASGNTAAYTIATGITPGALALDGAGNVYTAVSGSVMELQRTQAAASFSGSSAAASSFTLLSTGNQALTLTGVTQTDSADYKLTATSSTDCTVSNGVPSALALGGGCLLSASYAPTSATNTSDVISFNGPLANTALAVPANLLQLSLTGLNAPVTTTLALGAVSPAMPTVATAVSLTATVTAASGTPAGNVTFTVDGVAQTPVAVAGGVATLTVAKFAAGTHTIGASFTATNGFGPSTATAVSFVVKATPSLTLTVAPAVTSAGVLQGTSLSFTARLSNGNAPTGTVSFLDGTRVLQAGVALSGGQAVYTTSTLSAGAHSLTAVFAGDAGNTTATSPAVAFTINAAVTAGFTGPASLGLEATSGTTASGTLSYTPNAGYAGNVTLACSGQPSGVTCAFNPASLSFQQGTVAAQSTTLTVTFPAAQASLQKQERTGKPWVLALLLPFSLGLWTTRRRVRVPQLMMCLVVLLGGLVGLAGLAGCGGGGGTPTPQPVTYRFNVVASDGVNTVTTPVVLIVQ